MTATLWPYEMMVVSLSERPGGSGGWASRHRLCSRQLTGLPPVTPSTSPVV
jgi:hypothetical protein